MAKRRMIVPLEELITHPIARRLPPASYGALCRLVHHFIETDFAPLPTASQELMAISRANWPAWKRDYQDIMAAIGDVLPGIETYRRRRETSADVMRFVAAATNAKRKLKTGRDLPPSRTTPQNERPPAEPAALETGLKMWKD